MWIKFKVLLASKTKTGSLKKVYLVLGFRILLFCFLSNLVGIVMGNGESMYLDGRSMYLEGRSMYLDARLVELVRFLLLLIRVMGTNLPLRYKQTLE